MIEQLSFLVEPFERFALDTVGLWYAVTLGLMMGLGLLLETLLGFDGKQSAFENHSVGEVFFSAILVAPILEEVIFRIVPVELGVSVTGVVAISVLWALFHGRDAVFILLTVPLFVKMALAGMYTELILVHAFHNSFMFVAGIAQGEHKNDSPDARDEDMTVDEILKEWEEE